ncbi:MAG: hypothetical protein JWO05_2233 [Gemmatimonadetes bacterium]|nr:hypothetical protein [Gemmatimonadota bacterium]
MRVPPLAVVIALSAWIGAALLVAAVVAPAAFAVLPSRTLAGALVGRVLPVLFWSGIVVGAAVFPTSRVASVIMVASAAAAQLVVAPRIARIREAIGGPVDALAADDARRVTFGQLHGASVGLLGVTLLAAACALWLAGRSLQPRG